MGALKKLIGQTAVYGLSSIIGRLLSYLLVPLYTYNLPTEEYGIVTELYSYVAIIFAFLLYGMETTFFRFSQTEENKTKVLSTSSISLLVSTLVFVLISLTFRQEIANILGYQEEVKYITWFILILGFDALTSIPFAYLRQQNKALRFASIKLINISIAIGLNLFFILYCPYVINQGNTHILFSFVESFFNNDSIVQYIFISNLAASAITFIIFLPTYKYIKLGFDRAIWKKMMPYTIPILIVNIAGLIPISIDKILLPMLYDGSPEEGMQQLGIYGANAKIAVIMLLFIQTFRYAADPFFFAEAKNKNAKQTYARVMHWFVIFGSFIFLSMMMFMDVISYFIGADYREGAYVIPILLMGNLMLGIYYNLSFWYKLNNKTMYGAWFSTIGAIIAILLNFILVPIYGIYGSAWSVLAAYTIPAFLSFYFGAKHYPIPYQKSSLIFYPLIVVVFFLASSYLELGLLANIGILFLFLALVFVMETKVNPLKFKPSE
ncbi:MAG: polysaccharide biosynthesis C-terminal domain-containing protein [Bacteroidales bacterium]|nr:polysaccharide biosynthesis C-terminal domain-containing protein [Bacteroidales bacterium]